MFLIDYLRDNPGMYLLFVALVGLVVGSFLNVVVHRLPIMMQRDWRAQCREFISDGEAPAEPGERFDLASPGSRCPSCGSPCR